MGYFSFRKNSVDITTIPIFLSGTALSDYSVGLSGGYQFFLNSTVTSGTTSSTFNFTFNQQITLNAGDLIRLEFFRTTGTYYTTVNLNIYGENPAVLNSYIYDVTNDDRLIFYTTIYILQFYSLVSACTNVL